MPRRNANAGPKPKAGHVRPASKDPKPANKDYELTGKSFAKTKPPQASKGPATYPWA